MGRAFDNGAIQGNRLDFELDYLFLLQPRKDPIKHARLAPAVHAGIDGMPVAQPTGQTAPFTALFGHIQDRIDYFQIAQADVTTLTRKAVCNALILGFGDFHALFSTKIERCQLVLTRPNLIPSRKGETSMSPGP